MTMPGGTELVIILFIVLLLFGARKLPDLAGSMGKSIKEFRKASKEAMADDEDDDTTGRDDAARRDGTGDVTRAERDAES